MFIRTARTWGHIPIRGPGLTWGMATGGTPEMPFSFLPTTCIISEYLFIKIMVPEFFLFDQSSNLSFQPEKNKNQQYKNPLRKLLNVRSKYDKNKKHRGFLGQ